MTGRTVECARTTAAGISTGEMSPDNIISRHGRHHHQQRKLWCVIVRCRVVPSRMPDRCRRTNVDRRISSGERGAEIRAIPHVAGSAAFRTTSSSESAERHHDRQAAGPRPCQRAFRPSAAVIRREFDGPRASRSRSQRSSGSWMIISIESWSRRQHKRTKPGRCRWGLKARRLAGVGRIKLPVALHLLAIACDFHWEMIFCRCSRCRCRPCCTTGRIGADMDLGVLSDRCRPRSGGDLDDEGDGALSIARSISAALMDAGPSGSTAGRRRSMIRRDSCDWSSSMIAMAALLTVSPPLPLACIRGADAGATRR